MLSPTNDKNKFGRLTYPPPQKKRFGDFLIDFGIPH